MQRDVVQEEVALLQQPMPVKRAEIQPLDQSPQMVEWEARPETQVKLAGAAEHAQGGTSI